MNVVCRIKSTLTRRMDRQSFWALTFHNKKAKLRFLAGVLFLAVWFMVATPVLLFSQKTLIALIIIYFVMICIALRTIFQARIYANKRDKEIKKLTGGKTPQTEVVFYEDHFCYHSAVSDSKYEAKYDAVSALLETKDCYIVLIKAGPAIMFAKNSVAEGSFERALELLQESENTRHRS